MRLHNKHIDIILLGLVTLFLSSCSQSRSLDEQAVLAQSSFYDGEVAATVANAEQAVNLSESQTSGDGGFIPDPDDPNSDPDGGVIPPGDDDPGDDPNAPPVPPVADNDPPMPMPDDPPGDDPGDDPNAPPVPPVADNDPPMPMPDDPPGDDGGVPPVADNDPPDGGVIPPGDDPDDPPDGGDIPPDPGCQELVEYKLTRVCSERRSKLSSFLFFEEALHPIMTVTAYVDEANLSDQLLVTKKGNAKKRKRWLSMWYSRYAKRRSAYRQASFSMGGSMPSNQVTRMTETVLKVIDLSRVDLFAGPYSGSMVVDLTSLKAEYPNKWRKIPIKIAVCNDSNRDNSCENETQNSLSMHEHVFNAGHVPSRIEIPVWHGRNKNSHNHPDSCEKQYSPLVLDIKGNGFRMSAAEDSGVYFDLNNTGRPVYTGWVASSDDVFLVRDLNGNGRIDNGGELFGSATLLPNGERAENGFEALKPLDSNGDGYITRQDADYKHLRLWRDKNFNGYTDRGEMYRLRQARVASINLNYVDIMEVDPHGNETRQRSTFTKVSRGKRLLQQIVDIWFRTIGAY